MSSARPICGQVSAFYVVLRGETAGEWAECSQEFARNLVFLCLCILYLTFSVSMYLCLCNCVFVCCFTCVYLRGEEVGGVKPGICSEFERRIIFGEGWEKLIKEHQA